MDGRVLHFGEIHEDELEQIKGVRYSLTALLGEKSPIVQARERGDMNKFYHIVLYLDPGDYHGVHSPADWKIQQRRHFPGSLSIYLYLYIFLSSSIYLSIPLSIEKQIIYLYFGC